MAIRSIGKTTNEVNEIATAMEEQSAATQEIARNVQQAAKGTQEVSLNISGVAQPAGETGAVAAQSEMLRQQVDTFLSRGHAA